MTQLLVKCDNINGHTITSETFHFDASNGDE